MTIDIDDASDLPDGYEIFISVGEKTFTGSLRQDAMTSLGYKPTIQAINSTDYTEEGVHKVIVELVKTAQNHDALNNLRVSNKKWMTNITERYGFIPESHIRTNKDKD